MSVFDEAYEEPAACYVTDGPAADRGSRIVFWSCLAVAWLCVVIALGMEGL